MSTVDKYLKSPEVLYLIQRPRIMNALVMSVEFDTFKAHVDLWIEQYSVVFYEKLADNIVPYVGKL